MKIPVITLTFVIPSAKKTLPKSSWTRYNFWFKRRNFPNTCLVRFGDDATMISPSPLPCVSIEISSLHVWVLSYKLVFALTFLMYNVKMRFSLEKDVCNSKLQPPRSTRETETFSSRVPRPFRVTHTCTYLSVFLRCDTFVFVYKPHRSVDCSLVSNKKTMIPFT